MKKHLLLFFLLFSFALCKVHPACAQINLVPNNSFENYTQCPNDQDQIISATGWINFGGSPDYFNGCATDTNWAFHWSVPTNWGGYQPADGGNAYAGIFTEQSPTINAREYIGIKLLDTLSVGKKYFVSFKVSLAFGGMLGINCATNNIGALFSTAAFYYSGMSPAIVRNFAHIHTTQIVSDTNGWVTISGSFIADSAYQYMVIGNFFDDSLTSSTKYFDNGYSECAAYYYLDDIGIAEDTINGISNIKLQNKINIYPNPANVFITIEINNVFLNNAHLKIYDFLGTMKEEYIILKNREQIDISQYPAGVYLLNISTESTCFYQKLIIN